MKPNDAIYKTLTFLMRRKRKCIIYKTIIIIIMYSILVSSNMKKL